MAEPTGNERGHDGGDLASAARDRGMEQLESAKAQLAEGAERVAAAVERTADELDDGDGDAITGFGHSAATLMRRLAGGLRERDIEEFASELGSLARRNPGVFLAGSVALGFGIARFFKARPSRGRPEGSYAARGDDWRSTADRRSSYGSEPEAREDFDSAARADFDPDESLDLSAGSLDRRDTGENVEGAAGASTVDGSGRREEERLRGKGRQGSKQRAKAQRASASGSQPSQPTEASASASSADSASTGGTTGSGALRGDQS